MNTDKIYAESVAKEYAPSETSKVIALKKLDRKAKHSAYVFGYTFGIIITLLLGVGMCLCMNVLNVGDNSFFIGLIIGIAGIIGISVNPLIFNRMLDSGKKKYAADIIELARQITDTE